MLIYHRLSITLQPSTHSKWPSSSAWGVWPFLAAYSNSKAAMIHYTTTLAASYPAGNVLAVAVNPGLNTTDIPLGVKPREEQRGEEIPEKNLLTTQLNAVLGVEQFN
ncbi:hypothetical protein QBC46DRAFT_343220 [Diplogelasinospora grovesii]|uniref:Uncharacterized protein n=1 Tax=Diplogelasinospora grovesii TaxID=303347 RepID=A0AAN6N7F4_9PEZI|nr:hypothetical protein QBC46DRAFT_343220 [Diplogelasinospora grovesii]